MDTEPRLRQRTWGWRLIRGLVMAIGFVCMVAFAVALAKVTLVPSASSVTLTHTNLHPGSSIRLYFEQPDWRDTIKQVGGNVVLGAPFGFLLPVLFPRTRGFVRVVLMTAFVMLTVEIAQGLMVTGRAFDIDDVILNATGAFLGYLVLGRRLGRALHPRRDHWWRPHIEETEERAASGPRNKSRESWSWPWFTGSVRSGAKATKTASPKKKPATSKKRPAAERKKSAAKKQTAPRLPRKGLPALLRAKRP
ncbi:VanZ family protein [Streptomyces sp. BH104]|uniref:VanZ family protein n=1 Tax=unclassified Streptomyces TaxID=2593676 RepID=UPI003BB6BFA9